MFEYISSNTDRDNFEDNLVQFVKDINEFIKLVLNQKDYFILREYRVDLRQYWESEDNQNRLDSLQDRIQDLDTQQNLAEHGLTNGELELKIKIIKYYYDRWDQRGGSYLLHKIIDVIDNLLESLIDAIGQGGAIKELKDLLKGCIDED